MLDDLVNVGLFARAATHASWRCYSVFESGNKVGRLGASGVQRVGKSSRGRWGHGGPERAIESQR